MNSSAPLLTVALLAVLVGATLPVLYQLYRLLRRARSVLDAAGPHLEKTLDQVGQAADRLDGIGSILETQAHAIQPLIEVASSLGHSLDRTGHRRAVTRGERPDFGLRIRIEDAGDRHAGVVEDGRHVVAPGEAAAADHQ